MTYKDTDYATVEEICDEDVQVLVKKNASYGSSWRKRGGVGAFMMLARKWDRIENICSQHGYDILELGICEVAHETKDGILDDIADLRRYLLLVEEHIRAHS